MSMKVTRRQLAATLAGAASAAAQPVPTQPVGIPSADLADVQKQLRDNAGAIAKVPISQTVEPAFSFRA